MSRFATFTLGIPVLRHRVRVLHATPRTPTPFEAVVIDIVERFSAAPHYRDWSLETMFEELLCVPDPRPLLTATLTELIGLRALVSTPPFDDSAGVAVGNLALTDRGKAMARDKKLLGRQQEDIEQFGYDPIGGRRCGEIAWARMAQAKPILAVEAGDFATDWPEQAFRDSLREDRPDWYRADTQIEEVWTDGDAQIGWDSVVVEAMLDKGTIIFRSAREEITRYLATLAVDSGLRAAIVESIFSTSSIGAAAWPVAVLTPGAAIVPVPRALAPLTQEPVVLLSNSGLAVVRALTGEVARSKARVCFSPTKSRVSSRPWAIAWNESRDGCTVILDREFPVSDCDVATASQGWRLARASLAMNGTPTEVALAIGTQAPAGDATGDLRAQLLDSGDIQDVAAGLLLTPTAQAAAALANFLRAHSSGLALLDAVPGWGASLRHMKGGTLPGWDAEMDALFESALASHGDAISPGEVELWCRALASLGIARMEIALGKLAQRIEALQDAGLLKLLTEQLRALAPGMSLPWLPNLYPAAVLKQLLQLSSEKDLVALLVGKNRFETALRDLWRKGTLLAKLMGTPFPYSAPTDETVRKLATGRELVRFQNAVKDWSKQFDDFQQTFALLEYIEGSPLEAARNIAKQWQAAVERFLDASGVAFEHVFVVDTNALIDCPDLPQRLRPTQLLVLPATVIDELDKKKTDPQLRQQCAEAVRNLRAMPTAGIRFETADLTLVPDDYRKTNDSRILSVAAKYLHSNLRLVTGDQNLSLKAQQMNIIAIGVERFMDRPPPRRNSPRPTAPGSAAVTNKKKRTGT